MKEKSEILIVFATELETESLLNKLIEKNINPNEGKFFKLNNIRFEIFISGIGIPLTSYSFTKKILSEKYNLVINAGICGSYNEDLCIGDCVSVIMDEFADMGVTYKDNTFKTLFEEGLLKPDSRPFSSGKLYNPLKSNIDTELPKVTAITVNNVSGSKEQIEFRREKFNPDIESTEGAAIAYICIREKINLLQIRAISNKVEERNKKNWDIPLALDNLGDELIRILKKISAENEKIVIQ